MSWKPVAFLKFNMSGRRQALFSKSVIKWSRIFWPPLAATLEILGGCSMSSAFWLLWDHASSSSWIAKFGASQQWICVVLAWQRESLEAVEFDETILKLLISCWFSYNSWIPSFITHICLVRRTGDFRKYAIWGFPWFDTSVFSCLLAGQHRVLDLPCPLYSFRTMRLDDGIVSSLFWNIWPLFVLEILYQRPSLCHSNHLKLHGITGHGETVESGHKRLW